MSLLLDALKKAAEQKAEKSRREPPPGGSSDETEIHAGADGVSAPADSAESSPQQPPRVARDETEIDHSELEVRLERARAGLDEGTETDLETPDATEAQAPSAQIRAGEDETLIFLDEDVSEFMGDPELISREPPPADDETDLSRTAAEDDRTDLAVLAAQGDGVAQRRDDDTDISRPLEPGDQTEIRRPANSGDDTDISAHAAIPDDTDLGASIVIGDETDIRETVAQGDETDLREAAAPGDETDFREQVSAEDETDISVPAATVADLERAAVQQAEAAEDTDLSRIGEPADNTAAADDDMSLLLVDRDPTNLTSLTSTTSPTDPQAAFDQLRAMQPEGEDELALVDTTRHQLPEEIEPADTTQTASTLTRDATLTDSAATTGIAQDTETTQGATRRAETTSTRTYAPDNYDRTLMRLPSEDASNLFAGMKADSDVVMTPDYAKKVFLSKSSAQRSHHNRIYGGIAFAALLVIVIYGFIEYQSELQSIDTSLRPLKRDPMPGVIKPRGEREQTDLFAEGEVDARTIELVANAEALAQEPVTEAGVVADRVESDAGPEPESVEVIESEAMIEPASEAGVAQAEPEPDESEIETVSLAEKAPAQADDPAPGAELAKQEEAAASAQRAEATSASPGLQISSSSRIEDRHMWLRDAYAAYAAGKDELAMTLYNKVLEVDPGNRNALLARAAINVQNNDSAAAIADYQKLLLINPKDSLAMTSLISVASYSPEETESQLKLMIRDEPGSPYLNFALANAYGAQNRWQEAQGYYFRALENNPGDPNYAYNLAVSLEHISQPRAAISYYQRALDNFENGLATFSRDVVDQRLEVLGKP